MFNPRFLTLVLPLLLVACAGGGGRARTPYAGSQSEAMFNAGIGMMMQRPAYAPPPVLPAMPVTTDCTRLSARQMSCRSY